MPCGSRHVPLDGFGTYPTPGVHGRLIHRSCPFPAAGSLMAVFSAFCGPFGPIASVLSTRSAGAGAHSAARFMPPKSGEEFKSPVVPPGAARQQSPLRAASICHVIRDLHSVWSAGPAARSRREFQFVSLLSCVTCVWGRDHRAWATHTAQRPARTSGTAVVVQSLPNSAISPILWGSPLAIKRWVLRVAPEAGDRRTQLSHAARGRAGDQRQRCRGQTSTWPSK